MNGAIYQQPLVLFLGAGASVPLGRYATVQFWEGLRWKTGVDREILHSIERNITPSEEVGSRVDVEAALDCLKSIKEGRQSLEKLGFNVEDPSYKFIEGPKSIVEPPSRLGEYARLYEELLNLVVSHYSEIVPLEAFESYRPFLELAVHEPLPVFTTNYDLAIEAAYEAAMANDPPTLPFNLVDGFRRRGLTTPQWSITAYDEYAPAGTDVILFKLHGSVDWVRTPLGAIQRVTSRQRDPGGMKTEIAYPSRLKREIHEEPYRTNYDYLLACLLHAKGCAVIGFSFRDQEIVEEFRQAMQLNEELKVIIVDPRAEEIESHLRGKLDPTSVMCHRITGEFQQGTAPGIAEEILSMV